jgi:hypothetical protein
MKIKCAAVGVDEMPQAQCTSVNFLKRNAWRFVWREVKMMTMKVLGCFFYFLVPCLFKAPCRI